MLKAAHPQRAYRPAQRAQRWSQVSCRFGWVPSERSLRAQLSRSPLHSTILGGPLRVEARLRTAADAMYCARTERLARRLVARHDLTLSANGELVGKLPHRHRGSFGHRMQTALPEAYDSWNRPLANARDPLSADNRVLLISGLLEVSTPHEQLLAVPQSLPWATLLTLTEVAHREVLGPLPVLDRALDAFLPGESASEASWPSAWTSQARRTP